MLERGAALAPGRRGCRSQNPRSRDLPRPHRGRSHLLVLHRRPRVARKHRTASRTLRPPSVGAPVMTSVERAFPALLHEFFHRRLIAQRGASTHTIASYRDTFTLFLGYATQRTGRTPSALTLSDLDAPVMGRTASSPVRTAVTRASPVGARNGTRTDGRTGGSDTPTPRGGTPDGTPHGERSVRRRTHAGDERGERRRKAPQEAGGAPREPRAAPGTPVSGCIPTGYGGIRAFWQGRRHKVLWCQRVGRCRTYPDRGPSY